MYEPNAKRKQRIRLTFTYAVMTLLTLALVTAVLFIAQGYRYNQRNGMFEQGGMIQFDSKPNGATIQLDAVTLANRTATRITATSGGHTVTVSRDGYAPWQKQVKVTPGSVLWLNYIRLVPTNPATTTAASYDEVSGAIASPNREWLAVIGNASDPTVTFVKPGNSAVDQKAVTLATDVFTHPSEGQTHSFELVSWDVDSRRVTVKHTYDGAKTEYIVVPVSGDVQNITKQLGVSVADLQYDPTDFQTMYVLTTDHEIRRINLGTITLSGPLVTNASSLSVAYNGWIGYATNVDTTGARTVGYLSKGKTTAKTIQTYTDMTGKSLNYTIGRYYNEMYQLVTTDKKVSIYKLELPASDVTDDLQPTMVAQVSLASGVSHVGFSPKDQRFVYVQHGQEIVTYDLELASIATVSLSTRLQHEVAWLDEYHLLSIAEGVVEFADYDGTNRHVMARDAVASAALISPNNRYFYYFAKSADTSQVRLVRVSMLAS